MNASQRHCQAAESMLALLTTREAAAAIVGDLMESRALNVCRFWLDIASTGSSLLIHSVRRKPFGTLSLCALGFLFWFLIYSLVRVLFAAAGLIPLNTTLAECAVISLWSFALFSRRWFPRICWRVLPSATGLALTK